MSNEDKSDDGSRVSFKIELTRIVENENTDNKYVIYLIKVEHKLLGSSSDDTSPVFIERRYTHFNNLYTALKQEFPDLMASVSFPRKVLLGNFDIKLLDARTASFETMLKLICSDFRLINSPAFLSFVQDIELKEARNYQKENTHHYAIPLLEKNFRILNKIYTDRTKAVLLALCRLIACCVCVSGSPHAEKWLELALHRYEGVSDSDLLTLYIPLLKLGIKLFEEQNKDTEELKNKLNNLQKMGIRITNTPSLAEALDLLEDNL